MYSSLNYSKTLKFKKKIYIKNYQKCTKKGWAYSTYNWINVIDINAHNDQGSTGIQPALLSLADELHGMS